MASQNTSIPPRQLVEMLASRIISGYYPRGHRLPTERALTAELGVGRAAVRFALIQLAERGLIDRSPGCRAWISDRPDQSHVLDKIRDVSPTLRVIAAILPHHPIYPAAHSILRGINLGLEDAAAPSRLLVFDTHAPASAAAQERAALEAALNDRVSGVILWQNCGDDTIADVLRVRNAGVPVIFVDRCPANLDCDYVGVDNHAAAQEAVEHLIALGHRRIAHVTEEPAAGPVAERIQGYRDALRAAGILPDPELLVSLRSSLSTEIKPALDHLFRHKDSPTAIFAVNDAFAHAIITQMELQGRYTPRDVSVVGFDDLERYSPRPALLTTIHQPFVRIGRRATQMLIGRIQSKRPAVESYQHVLMPTSLIVRTTTGAPPGEHWAREENQKTPAVFLNR